MIRERENAALPGLPVLIGAVALIGLSIYEVIQGAREPSPAMIIGSSLVLIAAILSLTGLFVVNPNEGKVLQFFGSYAGTVKRPGLRWANPLYTKKRISQRIRNFESSHLKVNDNEGNPIEIAAVVVWRVVDTAEAVFEVDDYNNYVKVQTESALRNLATSYTYDTHDEAQMSLRGHTAAVAEHLKNEIQDRLARAGVEVMEARISHLAYAPEIAHAMLQRQQAGRDHRRAAADRRRRGRHGGDGARHALAPRHRHARQRAEGRHGQQPAGRAVRRQVHAADRQRRHDLSVTPWPNASRSCCGSTARFSTPFSAGQTTSCAA